MKQTREAFEDHGHDPGVSPLRFTTPEALLSFLDSDQRPQRTRVIDELSHPSLTGMSQQDLHTLATRIAARQAAQAERLHHQRRDALTA